MLISLLAWLYSSLSVATKILKLLSQSGISELLLYIAGNFRGFKFLRNVHGRVIFEGLNFCEMFTDFILLISSGN